jgi:hypothetical protein
MVEKNEFDSLDEDVPPTQEFVDKEENMIASGGVGTKYDWHTAPDRLKAPPRIDLNGKTVTITDAEIILPPQEKPWLRTRKGDKEYKYCTFVLHYSEGGQQEYISGLRVFKAADGKYSHPTITRDGKTQASALLVAYADYKKKDVNECSLREFMSYLTSKPKAVLHSIEVTNPVTEAKLKKNMVEKFI